MMELAQLKAEYAVPAVTGKNDAYDEEEIKNDGITWKDCVNNSPGTDGSDTMIYNIDDVSDLGTAVIYIRITDKGSNVTLFKITKNVKLEQV